MKYTLILLCILLFSGLAPAQNKPNILHIVADDVGWDDLSCFGSMHYRTPNLDQLAKEGVRLVNFYAPHGTCTPSRAAFLTGRYSPRANNATGLGVLFPTDTIGLMPEKELTFAKILQQQGYNTALIGKWHLGSTPRFLPPAHGFNYFYGIPYPNDHGPERLGGSGSRGYPPIPLIENNTKLKDLNNTELAELPHEFVRKTCQYISTCAKNKQPFYVQYANIETHTPWFIPQGFEGLSSRGAYGDAVEYLDRCVGIILKQVKALGIENNTMVVFHSDNGPLLWHDEELINCYGKYATVDTTRKHILRDGKYQEFFEGGVRVSCIVKYPEKIPANTVNKAIFCSTDLFATFVETSGGKIPNDRVTDGKNLLPLISGQRDQPEIRNTFYAFKPRNNANAVSGVRYKDWKLALEHRKQPMQVHLFNLANDPGEQQDLSAKFPNIVQALRRLADEANIAIKNEQPLQENNQLGF
jgi:arylsulfatase A-like enzyme